MIDITTKLKQNVLKSFTRKGMNKKNNLKFLVCVVKPNQSLTVCELVFTVFRPVQIKCYDFVEEIIVLYVQGKDCVLRLTEEYF